MSRRVLFRLAAFLGIPATCGAGTLLFIASPMCANDELASATSPGGAYRAVAFRRDCGATTGFNTQVSILPARASLPDDGGNVFVADDDNGRAPAGAGVELAWNGARTLLIRHHPRTRVFRAEQRVGDVVVRFERR